MMAEDDAQEHPEPPSPPPQPPPDPQESPFPKPTMEEIGKDYDPSNKETRDD